MAYYRKTLDTSEGIVAFTFTRVHAANGIIYFVSATGLSMRLFFHMEKRDRLWKIINVPRPPEWLFMYEQELAKVITDNQG